MLPKRREPVRSGITRAPKREWPRHRSWVRKHECCVPGCEDGPIEFAHVRSSANSGTALKPNDADGVSLCRKHHAEQHNIGAVTFMKRYNIDLWAIAREFAERSIDTLMKEAIRNG